MDSDSPNANLPKPPISSTLLRPLSPGIASAASEKQHNLWRPFVQVSLVALFVRAIILVYGELQDRYLEVKFTDIDYWVFTDAARALALGNSPFDRSTFRYTPLLAYLLLPNIWLHPAFGKVVFALLDIVAGFLIFKFMTRVTNGSRAALILVFFWYLNPLTFTISTRGNAESLMSVLVLSFLYFLSCGHIVLSGVIYGLAVHFKLYPVIYAFAILSHFLRAKRKTSNSLGLRTSPKKSFSPPSDPLGSPSASPLKNAPSNMSPSREGTGESPLGLKVRKTGSKERLVSGSPLSVSRSATFAALKKPHLVNQIPASQRIRNIVVFGLSTAVSFLLATGFCYWKFGDVYLREAIFYHLGRQDHRHNFSPYFYLFYTSVIRPLPPFAEILTFIPQLLFFIAAGLKFGHRDLPFSCFIITFVFVTFNKVITSQYFIWYLTLFPIAYLSLHNISIRKWAIIGAAWFGAQALWLSLAYNLEFKGQSVFLEVWAASLLFLVVNVWIAGQFIRHCLVTDVVIVKPGVITQSLNVPPF